MASLDVMGALGGAGQGAAGGALAGGLPGALLGGGLGLLGGIAGGFGKKKAQKAGEKWEKKERLRNMELKRLAMVGDAESSVGRGLHGDVAARSQKRIGDEYDRARQNIQWESGGAGAAMLPSPRSQALMDYIGMGSNMLGGLAGLGLFDRQKVGGVQGGAAGLGSSLMG